MWIVALALTASAADVELNYTGRVVDALGTPVTGSHTVRVGLYDVASGGAPLWTAPFATTLEGGYFNVVLATGDGPNPTIDADWFATPVWVGLTIDSGSEMTPRQELLSGPSAAHADVATASGSATRADRVRTSSGAPALPCTPGEIVVDNVSAGLRVCVDVGGGTGAWRTPSPDRVVDLDAAGHRRWSDGSYATSCNSYKNPGSTFKYIGATGDGVYRIDPDGAAGATVPFDAYCDMTRDGGGWTLIANIADDDGTTNWSPFNAIWRNNTTLGSTWTNPALASDAKSTAYATVPGTALLLYYNGTAFLQTTSCLSNNNLAAFISPMNWTNTVQATCSIAYHNTSLSEKALSCTGGTTNCGAITSLHFHWGENSGTEVTNNDQVMLSSNRRSNISSVGGLGSRMSNNQHVCGTICNIQDVSEDNDTALNITGAHNYGIFIR
jgi:hypothetical protein